MGYFLEITKGYFMRHNFVFAACFLTSILHLICLFCLGQKLEEMDISVHCDISIFEWLMKWIKRDTHGNASDSSPKLG